MRLLNYSTTPYCQSSLSTWCKLHPKKMLVKKTLRSLSERLSDKVIAIEKAKDISIMKHNKLMGYLEAYAMTIHTD